ncbi:unnamed protein product, partial [marine sediment metagenome]
MAELTFRINGDPNKASQKGNEMSIEEIAIAVTSQAKTLAPVNKKIGVGGQLRGSIMYKTFETQGGFGERGTTEGGEIDVNPQKGEGYVGTNVNYAIYQEFGTKKMAGQPFLRPAIALLVTPELKEEIKKEL